MSEKNNITFPEMLQCKVVFEVPPTFFPEVVAKILMNIFPKQSHQCNNEREMASNETQPWVNE